jgi:hypothetical protein
VPKFIPRIVFQLAAGGWLLAVWAGAAGLALLNVPPWRWLYGACDRAVVLTAAVWWIGFTVPALVPVLVLRLFAKMPTLREEVAHLSRDGLTQAQRSLEQERRGTPRQRRWYHAKMGAASVLVTGASLFALALNLELEPSHLYVYPPILAVIGALMLMYHFARFVIGR